MSTMTKSIPTPDEVRAQIAGAAEHMVDLTYLKDFTIADYPIGRRERGQCRLSFEFHPKKGFRTVRETTNKWGKWCAPKKSTFKALPHGLLVVTGGITPKEAAWLSIGTHGASLYDANGDCLNLAAAPHWTKPRREREVVRFRMTPIYGLPGSSTVEEHVSEPDAPELCDAYDAWEAEWKPLLAEYMAKGIQLAKKER